jgi:hypothetical protein
MPADIWIKIENYKIMRAAIKNVIGFIIVLVIPQITKNATFAFRVRAA